MRCTALRDRSGGAATAHKCQPGQRPCSLVGSKPIQSALYRERSACAFAGTTSAGPSAARQWRAASTILLQLKTKMLCDGESDRALDPSSILTAPQPTLTSWAGSYGHSISWCWWPPPAIAAGDRRRPPVFSPGRSVCRFRRRPHPLQVRRWPHYSRVRHFPVAMHVPTPDPMAAFPCAS